MCEALFWVWNLRSEDFFWVWNFVVTFFGWEISVRTFFGVDKKRNPGFSFSCQTILLSCKNCLEFSWIIIIIIFFLIGLFLGYIPGRWTFFGSGSSLKDFFLGLTITPHSHIPVTNILEYPPGRTVNEKAVHSSLNFFKQVETKRDRQANNKKRASIINTLASSS